MMISFLGIIIFPQEKYYPDLKARSIKKMDKVISKTFDSESITKTELKIPESVLDDLEYKIKSNSLFLLKEDEQLKGLLFLSSAMGRFEFFDYMVIYETDLRIKKIEILVYRSEHGFEIMNKSWLKKFVGKNGCDLVYAKDIDAISGATLSANSLTDNLNIMCHSLRELEERKLIVDR